MLLHGSFPVTAIELLSDHTPHSAFVQAVGGDSKAPGVGARSIEALDTTSLAEGVLGFVRVKGVCGYALSTLQEFEPRSWNNEVSVLLLLANATV